MERLASNHAMKRTATRLVFTRCITRIFLVLSQRAPVAVAHLILVRRTTCASNFLASAAALLIGAASAVADCDGHPTVKQEFKTSALVFVGQVTSARDVAVRSTAITGGTFYSVDVVEVLKGRPPQKLELYSENSSGRFPMDVGVRYVIFADYGVFEGIRGQQLAVSNCGNSAPLPEGQKTLETVRRLKKA